MNSDNVIAIASLVTALVAVIGIVVTIWKQLSQREIDNRRHLDEQFSSVALNLSSESPSLRASAAVSILTFLKPEYKDFHEQVFMILLASLKLESNDTIARLLSNSFEKAIRLRLKVEDKKDKPLQLDLSHCILYQIDLSGLDLREADLAFSNLKSANLTHVDLQGARGWEANLEKARLSQSNLEEVRFRKANLTEAQFHDTRLVSARLEETDLTKVEFYKAKMQGAHLDEANLRGARFEQADLNDTFFRNVKNLDDRTLKSITRAKNWKNAHFDENVIIKLEQLAASDNQL